MPGKRERWAGQSRKSLKVLLSGRILAFCLVHTLQSSKEVHVYRKSALLISLSLVIATGCKSPEQKAAEDASKNLAEAS